MAHSTIERARQRKRWLTRSASGWEATSVQAGVDQLHRTGPEPELAAPLARQQPQPQRSLGPTRKRSSISYNRRSKFRSGFAESSSRPNACFCGRCVPFRGQGNNRARRWRTKCIHTPAGRRSGAELVSEAAVLKGPWRGRTAAGSRFSNAGLAELHSELRNPGAAWSQASAGLCKIACRSAVAEGGVWNSYFIE